MNQIKRIQSTKKEFSGKKFSEQLNLIKDIKYTANNTGDILVDFGERNENLDLLFLTNVVFFMIQKKKILI